MTTNQDKNKHHSLSFHSSGYLVITFVQRTNIIEADRFKTEI